MKERLTAGNRSYFSLQKLLRSKNLSRGTKKIIYTTIIRPVVTYASETWTLTRKAENLLNIWERKILQKIYGPVIENDIWRIRTNQELYHLYKDPPIVTSIKKGRLRWAGHVERMPECRAPKIIYRQKPGGRRLTGRPRLRWIDDVETDLQQLGVRAWRRKAIDRSEWKDVVEQARALHGL